MSTSRNPFYKIVRLGTTEVYDRRFANVFLKIEYTKDGRLSISGVEGPTIGGNALGGCGQISIDSKGYISNFAPGWTQEQIDKLAEIWDQWHLNDMRSNCKHQKDWDTSEQITVVTFGLNLKTYQEQERIKAKSTEILASLGVASITEQEQHLLGLKSKLTAPDYGTVPNPEYYEEKGRKTEAAGWVRPEEHPKGLLTKTCPECGYKYGTARIFEAVPVKVLQWLRKLPETDKKPNWV